MSVDRKQFEASADYFLHVINELDLSDQVLEFAQELLRRGVNTGDEMLEENKKCPEENKKRFAKYMKCFVDYSDGLNDQRAGLSRL